MTRRKQNYPKRLNCSTEDLSTLPQTSLPESDGDNSEDLDDEAIDTDNSDDGNQNLSPSEIHEDIPKIINSNPKLEPDTMTIPHQQKSTIDRDDIKSSKSFEIPNLNSPEDNKLDRRPEQNSSPEKYLRDNSPVNNNYKKFDGEDTVVEDQPLDLSTRSKEKPIKSSIHIENGHSGTISSSLKSLQLRFGGDFNIEPPRKPSNIVPLQPTILQGKSSKHAYLTATHPPLSSQIKSNLKPQFIKKEKPSPVVAPSAKKLESHVYEEDVRRSGNKYTTHRCSCQKTYTTLQALSSHIQDTGHTPANCKAATLLDYPKLVRGQDMWLNQESEQTRRILRCMQCGESFQSLPMLTVHMMKTQHYTKIVSADHGRRSHKCSAYCEKELERECVFKCKVCQEAFVDMEALANHMVQSGHHKKQILRAQNYSEFTLRNRRKRYHSDDGNNAMTSLIDMKRKCLPLPNGILDDEDSELSVHLDNSITCENCGKKIEMKHFVDHVRACIRQKSSVIGALKNKLLMEETSINKSDCENSSSPPPPSTFSDIHDKISPIPSPKKEIAPTKVHVSQHLKSRILEAFSPRKQRRDEKEEKTFIVNGELSMDHETEKKTTLQRELNKKSSSEAKKDMNCTLNENKLKANCFSVENEERKEAMLQGVKIKTEPVEDCDSRGATPFDASSESEEKIPQIETSIQMDILDPNAKIPESNSALKAMESFIQNSFTSKFDFRNQNCIPVPSNFHKTSSQYLKRESTSHREESPNKYSKYKHLHHALHQKDDQNGQHKNGTPVLHHFNHRKKNSQTSYKSKNDNSEKEEQIKVKLEKNHRPQTPESETSERGNNSRNPSPELNNSIIDKYLNIEEEATSAKKEDSSALDSLSSFVYSQPMTSEHPLDSLQRLLTRTDIPKVLSQHFDIPYLPGIPEMTLPLNLSLKPNFSDDEDQDDTNGGLEVDVGTDGMSSNEERASPVSEGEQRDYKCAACSRQFVSKGSYRYHLSRCHLSSVHKYGIKEAFNMSPYIYLPLDHTAKFSKYYEMAYELANKGK
ncbi:uncharacterized protein LOC126814724 [Patella vulgata]|uniref:uncharacterized protein LOC126814724 n=1 Tax=Patella vulgata TaxID=6465 RepID=UPI0021803875|nr:uncharacterized protein LOC126814724 [Patella vulgata]